MPRRARFWSKQRLTSRISPWLSRGPRLASLSESGAGQNNYYQSVFSELYHRFGVSSHKNIRQDQYQAVLDFLDDWQESVAERGSGNEASGFQQPAQNAPSRLLSDTISI